MLEGAVNDFMFSCWNCTYGGQRQWGSFYDAQTDRCMSTQNTTRSVQGRQTFLHVCIWLFYKHEMKRLCVDMTQNLMKKGSKCGTDIPSQSAKTRTTKKAWTNRVVQREDNKIPSTHYRDIGLYSIDISWVVNCLSLRQNYLSYCNTCLFDILCSGFVIMFNCLAIA